MQDDPRNTSGQGQQYGQEPETPPLAAYVDNVNVSQQPSYNPQEFTSQTPQTVAVTAVPPDSSATRTTLELAGLFLAILLVVSMVMGITVVSQVALGLFAAVGVFAVFRDVLGFKKSATSVPLYNPSPSNPGGPTVTQAAPIPAPKPRNWIKVLGITTIVIVASIFVLPFVGMFLFLLFLMVMTGGKGT